MDKLPSKEQIRQWVKDNPDFTAKRDIAKAFGIKSMAARTALKQILAEMAHEGTPMRATKPRKGASLPPVALLQILPPDSAGDLWARPLDGPDSPAPRIQIIPQKGDPALGAGDKILARLSQNPNHYEARLIRKLGRHAAKVLGIFRATHEGGRIVPIDKGADKEWRVSPDATLDAKDGELVEAEQTPGKRLGLPQARITARIGDPSGPRAISLIAIHQHNIPHQFPDNVLQEADNSAPIPLGRREDLRDLPLVTIDPPDARDRDDAVYAMADPDPQNSGGFIIWVAIADVAAYVRPQTALDREARKRGNSTYFPDLVVPMLPDMLSGDLCSLHQGVDRPCMAVRMVIDAQGRKIGHRFTRALMRSQASLSYEQVQRAMDGHPDPVTDSLLTPVLRPLYGAYGALGIARTARQPLELDLPERKIILSETGKVTSVAFYERFDAHKLIEEFMVLANVAAAEELIRHKRPLLFRVHEEPSPDKLDALREVAMASGLTLAKGQVLKTAHLNRLLKQAHDTEFDELINISTLRSMTQAYYSPQNFAHFGLALRNYAHFTSPIRRYADLIIHRALIAAHGWGDDGLSAQDIDLLDETAKQISDCERRSMVAERDTNDRYLAAYLSERLGQSFTGRVAGVQKFGLFIKLDETGADGLVPIREVGREYFYFDPDHHTLCGSQTGLTIGIGQRVLVRLREAAPITGGLTLELLELEGTHLPTAKKTGRLKGRPPRKSDRAAKPRKLTRKGRL